MNAQDWIERLGLQPHPEGGHYKEAYRATFQVTPASGPTSDAPTSAVTSIYYLLQGDEFSAFHRIAYPEIWYWHEGSEGASLDIHEIDQAGNYRVRRLGKDKDEVLSLVVEPGVWFAAEVAGKQGYGLVSCAVAPGFDFKIFEMSAREAMLFQFPEHMEVLTRLCPE